MLVTPHHISYAYIISGPSFDLTLDISVHITEAESPLYQSYMRFTIDGLKVTFI